MSISIGESTTLEEMWVSASSEFASETKEKLLQNPPWTFYECVNKVQTLQLQEQKTNGGSRSMMNVIECLKLFGGIAAEAAGLIFPPASLCFNAVASLIDMVNRVHDFHQLVNEAFGRLWHGLATFEIYKDIEQFRGLHPQLKMAIHRLMISFVNVCALTMELHYPQKRHKLKRDVKVFFMNDDYGLTSAVEEFERLARDQLQIQNAQTMRELMDVKGKVYEELERASEMGKNIFDMVSTLHSSAIARQKTEKRNSQLATIRSRLNVHEKTKRSNSIAEDLRERTVRGTAVWFKNEDSHPDYAKWANIESPNAKRILVVTGERNTGKSVLMSAIRESLIKAYRSTKTPTKTWVAAYFYSASVERKTIDTIETVIKCIAYNLAEQDDLYLKVLHETLDSKRGEDIGNAPFNELWELLDIGSSKIKSNHYVIIDGLAEVPPEKKDELFETMAQCMEARPRLRVAITELSHIFRLTNDSTEISLESNISQDIRTVVKHRLAEATVLQERRQAALRRKIEEKLCKPGKGSFANISTTIERIRKAVETSGLESDVEKILETLGPVAEVTRLGQRLSANEIDELNQLLVWVKHGKGQMTIEKLEAALFLRFKEQPLESLDKKLKGRYSTIFKLTGSVVELADDMDDATKKVRTDQHGSDQSPRFSVRIEITKGDLASVQSFLWGLSEKLSHENSKFQSIDGNVKDKIGVNKWDAHISIVQTTMDLLRQEPRPETHAIAEHTLCWLPEHLEELLKAEGVNAPGDNIWSDIGFNVVGIFTGDAVWKHWESCDSVYWHEIPTDLSTFRSLLSEPRCTARVGSNDLEWVKGVQAAKHPNRFLLKKIMTTVARLWLQDERVEITMPFRWLESYSRIPNPDLHEREIKEDDAASDQAVDRATSHEADGAVASDQSDDSASDKAADDAAHDEAHDYPRDSSIEAIEEWSRQVLKKSLSNIRKAFWQLRLGETYQARSRYREGAEAFLRAIKHRKYSHRCLNGLQTCLDESADGKQLEEICTRMEKALEVMVTNSRPYSPKTVQKLCFMLASGHGRLNHKRQLEEFTKRALESDPDDESHFEALRVYLKAGDYDHSKQLLYRFLDVGENRTRVFQDILHRMGEHELILQCWGLLKEDGDALKDFIGVIDGVLQSPKSSTHERVFLLHKGIGQHYLGHRTNSQQEYNAARNSWDQCLKTSNYTSGTYECLQAAMLLSAHHFERAMDTEPSDASWTGHVESLKKCVPEKEFSELTRPMAYLASCYKKEENLKAAEEILRPSLESAFSRLSDDVVDNDATAYYDLGAILFLMDDESNAHTAFNLLLPDQLGLEAMAHFLVFEDESTAAECKTLMEAMKDSLSSSTSMLSLIRNARLLLERLGISRLTSTIVDIVTPWISATTVGKGCSEES